MIIAANRQQFVPPRLRLPKKSLARLADKLNSVAGLAVMRSLLAELDPQAWAAVKTESWRVWYKALFEACRARFPVWIGAVELWLAESHTLDEVLSYGLPLDLLGIDDEAGGDTSSVAIAVGMIERQGISVPARIPEVLADYTDLVMPLVQANANGGGEVTLPSRDPKALLKGRGLVFAGPWANWPDYYRYMMSATGHGMLDYSLYDEVELPQWNMAEIRDLQEQWARATFVWENIKAFLRFVEESPATTIPTLVRLIMGDKTVLPLVTKKKGVKHG